MFGGQHIYKASDEILDDGASGGQLLHREAYEHSYPHCWRHKTPLIFRATPQWFVSLDQNGLREGAGGNREVQWLPDWGEQRIEAW